jgi:hypothetical protein
LAAEPRRPPDLTLRGTIEFADHHSYRLVPFEVPAGVARIEVWCATQFTDTGDGRRHWIRINARAPGGKLALIGNPIYRNWRAPH